MESGPLESDTPLGPVHADDLKRVWGLIRGVIADHGAGVGVDEGMISRQCGPGADVSSVFFRAALLQYLFESGVLDDWREGNELATSVFEVGASFPMERGVAGFDAGDFIGRLQRL
jgi:hypothetical protein